MNSVVITEDYEPNDLIVYSYTKTNGVLLVLPLGYRDSGNDYLANSKKVRWDDSKFFIRK